jgi:hypothetical protein
MPIATLNPSAVRHLRWGIFLTAFFFYMLTGSRERPWSDATPMWEVAENLVTHGRVDVGTRWPLTQTPGRAGKIYCVNPFFDSLVHVPAAAVRSAIGKRWPGTLGQSWPLAAHVAPSAFGALTCVLFFMLCLEHGASLAIAALATLAVGVASIVWVYARYPYSEILQIGCFTGAFLQLVRVAREPTPRWARWLGLWTGLLISSKTVYLLAVPGAALYLAWTLRRDPRTLGRVLLWTVVTMLPALVVYLAYNWVRWGSPLNDGYTVGMSTFQGSLAVGLWGLLLSPGKSLFLYSPPLMVALLGWRELAREHRSTLVLIACTVGPMLLANAALPFWHGDYAWGPRYLVFATPVLALPLCFVLRRVAALGAARRALAACAVAVVLALGVVVQVAGNAFHWDHWIRITIEARARWLGPPNRAGASPPDRGGICDACFEDLHQLHWLPPFNPIEGHLWLLRHVAAHDSWVTAEKDAPWHRYTRLQLPIAGTYARARLDWWPLAYTEEAWAAAILFALMLGGLAAGGVLCWRGRRLLAAPG